MDIFIGYFHKEKVNGFFVQFEKLWNFCTKPITISTKYVFSVIPQILFRINFNHYLCL